MTTFRAFKRQEYVPAKADFHGILGKLGLNQKLIEENLALEKRTARPFKLRDPHWWLYIELEWVICFWHRGAWRSIRTKGSYWDPIKDLPFDAREAHVFTNRGRHHRFYKRVFSYFKCEDWDIRDFSEEDRQQIFKLLKRGGMSQRVSA